MRKVVLIIFLIGGVLSCTPIRDASDKSHLKIDGSSTVYPITELALSSYAKKYPDKASQIELNVSGTGGGFQELCSGKIDIANASRKISPLEQQHCRQNNIAYLEIPVALDGIAIVVHPENDWVNFLTVDELEQLWAPESEREITRWNQLRKSWPPKKIRLYGPGSASGTYDYFTKSISLEKRATRGDYVATENDDRLVKGVANDTNSLGVFGLGYYQENFYKLRLIPIDDKVDTNGRGPVMPSFETVKNKTYRPFSRDLYFYIARRSLNKEGVLAFLNFFLKDASEIVREIGYVPKPTSIYTRLRNNLDTLSTVN